jgi:hypothetical protein
MIKTFTLTSEIQETPVREIRAELPDFDAPSDELISSLLNYSRSLEVKKSRFLDTIEVVKS